MDISVIVGILIFIGLPLAFATREAIKTHRLTSNPQFKPALQEKAAPGQKIHTMDPDQAAEMASDLYEKDSATVSPA